MSQLVVQTAPRLWSWSKNPMVLSIFNPRMLVTDRLRFEVYVADIYQLSGYRLIFEGSQTFVDGISKIELQRILDSELKYYHNCPLYMHSYTNDILPGVTPGSLPGVIYDKQTCKYKVKYGLSTESYSEWSTIDDLWCIKGGISNEAWSKNALDWMKGDDRKPIVLHESMYVQHPEAPIQFSFLFLGYPGDQIRVIFTDEDFTPINGFTYTIQANYGDVVHLSMRVPFEGAKFIVFDYFLDGDGIRVGYLNILEPINSFRLFSYINSLGGTDTFCVKWNLLEAFEYEEQLYDLALPISGSNDYKMKVDPQRLSERRERLSIKGDVSGLFKLYGERNYNLYLHSLRQILLSNEVREYEWGFYENERYITADDVYNGTQSFSRYDLRLIPVTISNKQLNVISNVEGVPNPVSLDIVRTGSNSQYLPQQRRSCSDDQYTVATGSELYGRLSILSNTSVGYGLTYYSNVEPRLGMDNGNGLFVWNSSYFAYSSSQNRVLNLDYHYMPMCADHEIYLTGGTISALYGQLPKGIRNFACAEMRLEVFNVALPNGIQNLDLSTNLLTKMPTLCKNMVATYLAYNIIATLTTANISNILAAFIGNVFVLDLSHNSLSQAAMDALLVALDTSGATNSVLLLNNQVGGITPSSTGLAAKTNMTGTKGWFILT